MKEGVDKIFECLKGCLPERTLFMQKFSIATYKALSKGKPVKLKNLENALDVTLEEIEEEIKNYPGIQRENSEIIGFWGLAINYNSPHKITFNDIVLNTWCAWDALFIPELVQSTAEVELTCPVSGVVTKLTVKPNEISNISNNDAVISFIVPKELGDNTIQNFCCFVHAFKDKKAFNTWKQDGHEDCFSLSLKEAFEIGQLKNRYQFGDVL
ncbi:MAG: hypothetical protein CME60_00860 [Halobacteriovoraceae bacterium]|nr:hypothetical protein [Halobacteriovoraceae bacterium]|tara:strand:+ start:46150 stop:46785 length:636 start_codon:yes stop_codon:yes gene_type:complete